MHNPIDMSIDLMRTSFTADCQILQDLKRLRQRLDQNDPSLTVFEPWKESSLLFSMEEPQFKRALHECLEASGRASCIKRVILRNLAEPELAYALKCLSKNPYISQVYINDDTKSHSIQSTAVVEFLNERQRLQGTGKGLQKLHISTRIVVSGDCHVRLLAQSLMLRSLQSVTLHILPRCPIRAPSISINPIAKAMARLPKLKCLQLVLGYQHNPYGTPMMSVSACHSLLQKNLLKFRLTNCGLTPAHVKPLPGILSDPECRLGSLQIDLHPTLQDDVSFLREVLSVVGSRNTSLHRFAWDTPLWPAQALDLLKQIQMWCRYNRLGRKKLRQTSGSTDFLPLLINTLSKGSEKDESLDLAYTIIRSHPAICKSQPARRKQMEAKRITRRKQAGTVSAWTHYGWEEPTHSLRRLLSSSHRDDRVISSRDFLRSAPQRLATF